MSPTDKALYEHLLRLSFAGGLSVVLGLALSRLKPDLRSFGLMNAAWGLVNLLIALGGSRNPNLGKNPAEVEGSLHFLLLNMGFNCGYIAVGITMMVLSGIRRNIRQIGAAVIVQGVILLTLDGYLLYAAPF